MGILKKVSKGQTLVEIIVATLISAMMTMAVFSVVLSSSGSQGKSDKKEVFTFILKQAQETLKSYVTADITRLPNGGKWAADTSPGWALRGSAGGITHDISSLMDQTVLRPVNLPNCGAGRACYFTYTVRDSNCLSLPAALYNTTTACKTVTFNALYPD